MWNTSFPPEVVVSRFSWRLRKPMPSSPSSSICLDEVFEAATEPVKSPDDQGVAGSEFLPGFGPFRPFDPGAAGFVFVDEVAAGFLQCVALQFEALVVTADTGVTDDHGAS